MLGSAGGASEAHGLAIADSFEGNNTLRHKRQVTEILWDCPFPGINQFSLKTVNR
jgi:hypothetical protein